jgi:hypothetical protein
MNLRSPFSGRKKPARLKRATRLALLPCLVLMLLLTPGIASAASWSVKSASVAEAQLRGVSCGTSSFCVGVGESVKGTNGTPVVQLWNGVSWVSQNVPYPTTTRSALNGVSCFSSSSCEAVGSTGVSGVGPHPVALGTGIFAEKWNGTEWSLQSISTPSEALGIALSGVSCTSASACTAVGLYTTKSSGVVPFAERWNGTAWSLQTVPAPAGESAYLYGVSCTSSTSCTAVGRSTTETNEKPLAEHWNGTEWKIQTTSIPTEATKVKLLGISCTSETACVAVGVYNRPSEESKQRALAEKWNGTEWKLLTNPVPSEAVEVEMGGVSCTSATACIGVGDYTAKGERLTLAESWNGLEWKVQSTPNLMGSSNNNLLDAVSCTSSTECTAVGYQEGTIYSPVGLNFS